MLIYKCIRQLENSSVNPMKALLTIVALLWLNKQKKISCSLWMVAEKKKKSSPKYNLLSGAEKWHSIQLLFTIYFRITQWLISQTRHNYSISEDRLDWMYNICLTMMNWERSLFVIHIQNREPCDSAQHPASWTYGNQYGRQSTELFSGMSVMTHVWWADWFQTASIYNAAPP